MNYEFSENNKNTIFNTLKNLMLDEENNEQRVVKKYDNNQEFIDTYIILDSFNKIRNSNISNGEYKWNIFKGLGFQEECVNIYNDLTNIVEICMGSFYMPMIEELNYIDNNFSSHVNATLQNNNYSGAVRMTLKRSVDSTVTGQYPYSLLSPSLGHDYIVPWINNPFSQITFANRFTVQLSEAGYYSYYNFNGTRYNFEFDATYRGDYYFNNNFLFANPISSCDKWDNFVFNDPIRNLTSLSLIFRNPDNPIQFEPDVFYNITITIYFDIMSGFNYIIFNTSNVTSHKLNTGDRFYIKNFIPKLPNGSINNNFPKYLTEYINKSEGHVASGRIPSESLTLYYGDPITTLDEIGTDPSIRINNPVDINISSSLPSRCDLYVAKRRLRIPMRFKSIKKLSI